MWNTRWISSSWLALGLALPALGCDPEPGLPIDREPAAGGSDTGMIDATPEVPELRDGAMRIETPPLEIGPYSDIIFCYIGSFPADQGQLAIDWVAMYENPVYGHHIQFNGLRSDSDTFDVPDGTLVDCTDPSQTMLATSQMVNMNRILDSEVGYGGEMVLPEGAAVPIEPGARWLFEVHLVNPTPRPATGKGVVDIRFVEAESVRDWVAPWVFNDSGFELPPGEQATVEVDCTWPQDATVLSLLGHMHEMGLQHKVEMVTPDGQRTTIYDLPEWDLDWRYQPVVEDFDGGLDVPEGTRFITTCTFFNHGSHAVTFPDEMCVASGLFMPASQTIACDTGRVDGGG
jgi:hypothetical protein